MKEIIIKWYDRLGFPSEWNDEFRTLLKNVELNPCAVEDFDDSDPAVNLPMYLYFCEQLEQAYRSRKIPESILMDTLSDIVIWAKSYYDINNALGLGETCWLKRHMTMQLFRLGRLQFCMADGELEVHIPAGAPMTGEECDQSFRKAELFFKEFFPTFEYSKFTCHSWLLDETLLEFLSESSNIVKFMRRFRLTKREESYAALKYIFRFDCTRENLMHFTAQSSLATRIKEHVLDGKPLYEVLGEISARKSERIPMGSTKNS